MDCTLFITLVVLRACCFRLVEDISRTAEELLLLLSSSCRASNTPSPARSRTRRPPAQSVPEASPVWFGGVLSTCVEAEGIAQYLSLLREAALLTGIDSLVNNGRVRFGPEGILSCSAGDVRVIWVCVGASS